MSKTISQINMPFFKKQNNQLVNYSEPSTAEGIAYDNTASGLTADNVQDAVDEINSNLTDLFSGDSEPVTQYSQIQRHTRMQIASEIPTASNIVTLFNALNTTGSYVVDFRTSGEETIRSTGLFSIVNNFYGAGIIVSYYNDRFYKVVNANGSVTITPM